MTHALTALHARAKRGLKHCSPMLLVAVLVAPARAHAGHAAAQLLDVLVVDSAVCDASNTAGHFQPTSDQVDNLPHGATGACLIMYTDAAASDTFSVTTVDAGGSSVYTSRPFHSQATAGTPVYYLLGPHMGYQNNDAAAWPDGTYRTTVTLDGTVTSNATWTVGAPPPTATPSFTATPVPPTSTPAPSPTATSLPSYHVRPNAPYALRLLPTRLMRGPVTAIAIDSAGDVLLNSTVQHPNPAKEQIDYDNHMYIVRPKGQVRELPQAAEFTGLEARAMNDRGEVVAYADGQGEGLVYRNGAWRAFAEGMDADPAAIDNRGRITGFADFGAGSYAFLADDRGGAVTQMSPLPCGCATWGRAIGPNGVVYGYAWGPHAVPVAVAFPPDGGPARDLQTLPNSSESTEGAVNAAGMVGGTAIIGNLVHVTRYDGAQHDLGAIPGWADAAVTGIDGRSRVVGYVHSPGPRLTTFYRAFVADKGGAHDLTALAGLAPGSYIQQAVGENAAGVILAEAQLGSALVPVVLVPSRYATDPLPGKPSSFPPPPNAQK